MNCADSTVIQRPRGIRRPHLFQRVGARLLRRIRYALLFVYWAIKHRSTSNARWIMEYEGHKWN